MVRQLQKKEVLQYSLLSIGLGADPGVQAVSSQATLSHPPSGRLPVLSARPASPPFSPDGASRMHGYSDAEI